MELPLLASMMLRLPYPEGRLSRSSLALFSLASSSHNFSTTKSLSRDLASFLREEQDSFILIIIVSQPWDDGKSPLSASAQVIRSKLLILGISEQSVELHFGYLITKILSSIDFAFNNFRFPPS